MDSTAKRLLHPKVCPPHDVGGGSHRAADESWVTNSSIVRWGLFSSRAERPRRPFAVDKKLTRRSINEVVLNLNVVVPNVIDGAHFLCGQAEDASKR